MATFLGLMEGLIGDPAEKAAFAADPDNYLSTNGFGELDADDVRTALAHTADAFPPRLAAEIDPDAGLAPVADVDLGQLGLSGFDDYAAPSDDALGGVEEGAEDGAASDLPDGPTEPHPGLDRDVDIDLDGDGIPDAPAASTATEPAHEVGAEERGSDGDASNGARDAAGSPVDALADTDDAATPAFTTATDPFDDPFADPGLGLDEDAPWMDPSAGSGLETVAQPDDDILDDVDDDFGQQ